MKDQDSKILIIAVIILSIASIVLSYYRANLTEPIRDAFSFVMVPMQKKINDFGSFFVEKIENRLTLKEANKRIEELEQMVASLSEANNILKVEKYENERLRELYDISDSYPQYEKTAARVIAKESNDWFQVFKIDKGQRDGIKVDMNVLSSKGLCGIVTHVGFNYATVRTIIDDESRVSAMSQHSLESCMVEGDIKLYNENRLKLTGIRLNSNISEGDRIVSANISSKYLPNLLIGYATEVEVNDNQLSKSGYVIPVTDFSNLTEVFVIKRLKSDSMRE